MVLLGRFDHVLGDVHDLPRGTQVFALPHEGLHLDKVDHPGKLGLGADRQLDNRSIATQALTDGSKYEVEVGTRAIHLVDEAHAGNGVLVGLPPDGLGLGLYACDPVEHCNGTIQHTK